MLIKRLDGLSYREIAEEAGVSRQRVQQMLSPPKEVSLYVHAKFSGRCADCGVQAKGANGHVHHRSTETEVDEYNDLDNLELLCPGCHRTKHAALIRSLIPVPDPMSSKAIQRIITNEYHCQVCKHIWRQCLQSDPIPTECPSCDSKRWDKVVP